MTGQTVEIRLELLKKQGEGYSKAKTVKHLTEKFHITSSGAYYHFETLSKWSSQYLDFENVKDFQFNILNQLNHVNREASFQYVHAQNDNAKIGYLRTRLEALSKMAEYAGLNVDKAIDPETGKVVHLHMWQPDKPDAYLLTWKRDTYLDTEGMTEEETEAILKADKIMKARTKPKSERESLH